MPLQGFLQKGQSRCLVGGFGDVALQDLAFDSETDWRVWGGATWPLTCGENRPLVTPYISLTEPQRESALPQGRRQASQHAVYRERFWERSRHVEKYQQNQMKLAELSNQCKPLSEGKILHEMRVLSGRNRSPLGQGGRATLLVGLAIEKVAFGSEVIVERGMD
jgi:hypothetical protein